MLKGQVFSRQLFENQIFALFIDTFLNGNDGVASNYANEMALSYSGSDITIDSGAVCIQGRFLNEDTSTTLSAGTDTMYCKLVIEIDLDKTNTESDFQQGYYKIITSPSGYPNLTQTNIVKNNAGVYQYELARFKTSANGISNFQDMRTFLDFESIYSKITSDYETVLNQLQNELEGVKTQENVALRSDFRKLQATINAPLDIHEGVAHISYPYGFNQNNTILINACIIENGNYKFNAMQNLSTVQLNENGIFINYNDQTQDVTGKIVEIAIMKK